MSVDVTALLNEERKTEDNSCEIEFQIFEGDQDDPEGDEASLQMAGTIFAHKAVLRMRSSVFKRQFFGALRRNGTDSLREVVKIKRCTFIGFGSLMESVYGNFEDVDKIVDFNILFDVIKLADRYDIQDVFEHVKLRIENFKLSSSSAFEVLKVLFVNKNLAGFSEICENGGKRVAELLHSEFDCVRDLVDLLYDGYQNESPMVVEWLVSNLREIDEDFTPNEKEWLEKVDKLESAKRSKRSLKRKIEDLEDSKARSTEKIRKLEQDVLDISFEHQQYIANQKLQAEREGHSNSLKSQEQTMQEERRKMHARHKHLEHTIHHKDEKVKELSDKLQLKEEIEQTMQGERKKLRERQRGLELKINRKDVKIRDQCAKLKLKEEEMCERHRDLKYTIHQKDAHINELSVNLRQKDESERIRIERLEEIVDNLSADIDEKDGTIEKCKDDIYWLKSKLEHNNSRCYNCNMDLASCLDDQAIDISKVSSVAQGCHVWYDYYCHSVKRISFMRNRAEGNFIELDNNKKFYMDRNGKTVIRFKCRCNCELGE